MELEPTLEYALDCQWQNQLEALDFIPDHCPEGPCMIWYWPGHYNTTGRWLVQARWTVDQRVYFLVIPPDNGYLNRHILCPTSKAAKAGALIVLIIQSYHNDPTGALTLVNSLNNHNGVAWTLNPQ